MSDDDTNSQGAKPEPAANAYRPPQPPEYYGIHEPPKSQEEHERLEAAFAYMREEAADLDAWQEAKRYTPGPDKPDRPNFTMHDGGLGPDDPPIIFRRPRLPQKTKIRPRQWLYGTQILRGFVSVLVAPGGTGKSTYAMTVAVAVAIGRKLLGEHVFAQVRTAIINLEDPLEELDRRLAAILMQFNIEDDDIRDQMFMHSGEDRPITLAALAPDGQSVVYPDEDDLIRQIIANRVGLLVVDPFAESHTLEENSNPHMVKAAAAWRRIARKTGCAILLIHHVRKGPLGDIDSARGAKGLTDSARVGLLLSTMTEAEAEQLNVPKEQRNQYVRLDDAKANMAPKATTARWFHLDRQELGNGTPEYPNGDSVATIVPWEPDPSVLSQTSDTELGEILDAIDAGPTPGIHYSPTKRAGLNNWAGFPLMTKLNMPEPQAERLINKWLMNGTLIRDTYRHPEQRRQAPCVRVNNVRRPGTNGDAR